MKEAAWRLGFADPAALSLSLSLSLSRLQALDGAQPVRSEQLTQPAAMGNISSKTRSKPLSGGHLLKKDERVERGPFLSAGPSKITRIGVNSHRSNGQRTAAVSEVDVVEMAIDIFFAVDVEPPADEGLVLVQHSRLLRDAVSMEGGPEPGSEPLCRLAA